MQKGRRFAWGASTIVILLVFVIQQLTRYLLYRPLVVEEQLFFLPKGANRTVFVKLMKQQGVTISPCLLRWIFFCFPRYVSMKAGAYWLQPGMGLAAMLQKFAAGETHAFSLVIAEGSTWQEWLDSLQRQPYLSHNASAVETMVELQKRFPWGGAIRSAEGLLFPDTYYYEAGASVESILERAYTKLFDVVNAYWKERTHSAWFHSPYELLIVASIIEKECSPKKEGEKVAGVIVNRLRHHIKLGLNTTVVYGLGRAYQGKGDMLSYQELRIDTPYNTYMRHGLPPSPICFPSLCALQAAARPMQHDYFYFVATGKGEHCFSKTLEDHRQAVQRYKEHRARGQERDFVSDAATGG